MIANSGQPSKPVTYARIAISDKSTICVHSSKRKHNSVAFPYDCQKYVQCSPSKEFIAVKSVGENMIYDPSYGRPTKASQLGCGRFYGKFSFIITREKNYV